MNFTFSLNNKKQKSDIALFCILLILTMIFSQLLFTKVSVVYAADNEIISIAIEFGKKIVGELLFEFAKEWTYKGIKWAISAITPAIALKIASLIIAGGIIATYIVAIVVIVDNYVTNYSLKNKLNGCVMRPGDNKWICLNSIPATSKES